MEESKARVALRDANIRDKISKPTPSERRRPFGHDHVDAVHHRQGLTTHHNRLKFGITCESKVVGIKKENVGGGKERERSGGRESQKEMSGRGKFVVVAWVNETKDVFEASSSVDNIM